MFKKMIISVLLLGLIPISTGSSFAAMPLHVIVNEKNYSSSNFILKDNRLYASIETVSSMMGALNGWVFKDKQSVSFVTHFSQKGNSDELYTWYNNSNQLVIWSKQAEEEKIHKITMNNSTIISKDEEILLPLRESIIALGKSIGWDYKTNVVTVTGKIAY